MLTAGQYGNSGAYFQNSSNNATGYMLGLASGFAGRRPVSVYSVIQVAGTNVSVPTRIATASAAIIGWLGTRPVAFPLTVKWNFNAPGT